MIDSQRDDWARALREARSATICGRSEFDRFLELAETARGGGLPEAKALVATLTNHPEDNGEGEAVLSLLSGFEVPIQVRAVLDELPRLSAEGELDLCESLVETEVRFHMKDLVAAARDSSPVVLAVLNQILSRISEQDIASGRPDIAAPALRAIGLG